MTKYHVTVAGWLPENQYSYGGTPEFVDSYWIEAQSAATACTIATARFNREHPDCEVVEATEGY